jgi:hypothetical protein
LLSIEANFNKLHNGIEMDKAEKLLGPAQHEVRFVGIGEAGMNARAAAFGGNAAENVSWRSRDGRCIIHRAF